MFCGGNISSNSKVDPYDFHYKSSELPGSNTSIISEKFNEEINVSRKVYEGFNLVLDTSDLASVANPEGFSVNQDGFILAINHLSEHFLVNFSLVQFGEKNKINHCNALAKGVKDAASLLPRLFCAGSKNSKETVYKVKIDAFPDLSYMTWTDPSKSTVGVFNSIQIIFDNHSTPANVNDDSNRIYVAGETNENYKIFREGSVVNQPNQGQMDALISYLNYQENMGVFFLDNPASIEDTFLDPSEVTDIQPTEPFWYKTLNDQDHIDGKIFSPP